jgi:hypothetical protein|tara:strand:- start:383 stop:667 length:285 start_codon:yes stop_codon:yes gene_type:complete
MPSNLPSKLFTQLLDEKLSSDVDMNRIHSLVKDDKTKSLNYEILYKFLESAVEEFILVNHGNPLVDDFRSKVFDKMGDVLNLLMGGTINKDDQN